MGNQTTPDNGKVITQGRWKGEFVGLTCSACHNAHLSYKGQRIPIERGRGCV
jgi:hypothetical protein